MSFKRPLTRARAVAFWRGVAGAVARGERTLLIAEDREGRILGTAQLVNPASENQLHRADVAKVLVHRDARRRGLARRLMVAIEDTARDDEKFVLMLDTVTGGDAERLYEGLGWQRVGVAPKYALKPDGSEFCAATFFYKHL